MVAGHALQSPAGYAYTLAFTVVGALLLTAIVGIDDGRGDISGLGTDVGAHVLPDGVALLLAGRDIKLVVFPSAFIP